MLDCRNEKERKKGSKPASETIETTFPLSRLGKQSHKCEIVNINKQIKAVFSFHILSEVFSYHGV